MSEYNREQAISWIYGKIGRGFHGDLKPTILEEAKRKFDLDGEEVVKIKRYFDEEYGWKLSSLRDRIALAAVKRELGSGDEQEIREAYKAMGQELAEDRGGWGGIIALSQYGHMLKDGFKSIQEAERYVVNYYSSRMNLLRQ